MRKQPHRSASVALLLAVLAAPASGQVISTPPRAAAGAQAQSGPRHEAIVTGSLMGGYDQDTTAQFAGPIEGVGINAYNSFGDLGLRYLFGNGPHSVEVTGRGYVNAYPGSDIDRGYGGEGRLQVGTGIGRTSLTAGANLRYDPFYTLGAFGALGSDVEPGALPDQNPVNGFHNEQTLNRELYSDLSRLWGRRQISSVRYSYTQIDRQGAFGRDLSAWNAQLNHAYMAGRWLTIGLSYAYSRTQFQEIDGPEAAGELITSAAEVQVTRTIRVSPSRSVVIGGGVGADHAEGILDMGGQSYQYWAPTARGSVDFDIGRSWIVAGDYRRAVVALDSISGQSFPSNTAYVRAGGPVAGAVSTALTVGYASGQAGPTDATAAFRTYTVGAQISVALSARWSALANYNWYDYSVTGADAELGQLPASFQRGSVRAGLSLQLPLTRRSSSLGRPQR